MIGRQCLFFTRHMSLAEWDRTGLLSRELLLYSRLAKLGIASSFVTYGSKAERHYENAFPGLRIYSNRFGLSWRIYERFLPWLQGRCLQACQVVKTNQTQGGLAAARSARLFNRPLYVRCGYLLSDYLAWRDQGQSPAWHQAILEETALLKAASLFAVPNRWAAQTMAQLFPQAEDRLVVHPNFVDADLFSPQPNVDPGFDIAFVGRLDAQKGIGDLLDVLQRSATLSALIVGDGPLAGQVEAFANARPGQITWHSRVENAKLPLLLAAAKLFVFPSRWEGHPKALIEAMAMGMTCICSDIPSLRSVIDHGRSGWLVPDLRVDVLADAIAGLLTQPGLRAEMGVQARREVLQKYTLDQAVLREMENFRLCCEKRAPGA